MNRESERSIESRFDRETVDRQEALLPILDELTKPVPLMNELRTLKRGYGEEPIDTTDIRFNEPLIALDDIGVANQAYYSRANEATGIPVAGVPEKLHIRRSIGELLARINATLDDPLFTKFFGGPVELYVENAWRDPELQRDLYDTAIPNLLRRAGLDNDEVPKRRQDIIALPSIDPSRSSPHLTGGAVDVILRFKQPSLRFAKGTAVPMGHVDGETGQIIEPDYFEQISPKTPEEKTAQRNRRAWYAIMSGRAFGIDTGLVVNPTEFWHWSQGDQLWARLSGEQSCYSVAPRP